MYIVLSMIIIIFIIIDIIINMNLITKYFLNKIKISENKNDNIDNNINKYNIKIILLCYK